MGTTATAIQSGEGVQLCWVLAIEGYERLITDHANLGAVTTAWVGTDWSRALPGLHVRGTLRQAIEPLDETIPSEELTFAVQPDDDDTFGVAVHKLKPSFKTRLTDVFSPAADGSGTLNVKQVGAIAAGSVVYYGGRQAKVTGTTATSITVSQANAYSPFSGDGTNRYSPVHAMPVGEFQQNAAPAKVQDCQRSWIGKKVALYLHRVSGGVLDARAQAQLEFAGRIKRVYEDEQGFTCIECIELRADIRDCVLHRDQWIGHVREGIRLTAGMKMKAVETINASTISESTELTVVASGAAGSSQINEGYYSIYKFASLIDKWLQANSASFDSDWSCGIHPVADGGGLRTVIKGSRSASARQYFTLLSTSLLILDFLGFDAEAGRDGYLSVPGAQAASGTTYELVSQRAPYRVKAVQTAMRNGISERTRASHTIECTGHEGTFWDQSSFLPPKLREEAESAGGTWSLFKIGGALYWGRYVSDSQLTDVVLAPSLVELNHRGPDPESGLTVEDSGEYLEVRQVLALAGSFSSLVPRLLASLSGDGTNHATYDVFPMGAGIPWSLLGDDFLASVRSLEQATRSGGLLIMLDRPTKLIDVLLPELILRFAWIIFKDGVYQFVSPPTPNALATDHTFDETNKAGQELDLRASSEVTSEWLVNVVKLDYGRTLDGEYHRHIIVTDPTSVADYGESKPLTIRAANSYADATGTGASVEDLIVSLEARHLPFFARPLRIVRRSISPALFHATPGETVTLSDDFVRDPTHGRRGMESRAGILIEVTHSWGEGGGEMRGDAVIMFSEEDRTYPMAPCAEVDTTYSGVLAGITFTNGYAATAAGGPALKLLAHQHSRSIDGVDVASFANSDKIRILEIDPADPTTYDAWDRTLAAANAVNTTNNILKLTADISAPAWSGATKLFQVTAQLYTAVQPSQKLTAYVADDGDGLILDEAEPNLYGSTSQGAYTQSNALTLPRYIANEADDEGRPLHTGLLADLGINLNHLVNYGAIRQYPLGWGPNDFSTETGTSYKLHRVWPLLLGGDFPAGFTRRINIAPEAKTSGGTGYVRITVSKTPPRGDSLTGAKWEGTKYQREYTTTSTSRTVLAVQSLNALIGAHLSVVFVSVELKATAGQTTTFYGLAEQWLGPLQVV